MFHPPAEYLVVIGPRVLFIEFSVDQTINVIVVEGEFLKEVNTKGATTDGVERLYPKGKSNNSSSSYPEP